VLGAKLEVPEPVAGPAQLGQAERWRGARGCARHGRARDTRNRSGLEIRRARGQTAVTRNLEERVLGTRINAGTAASARRQETDLRHGTGGPEVPARDDPVLGLSNETLEPVANCRS